MHWDNCECMHETAEGLHCINIGFVRSAEHDTNRQVQACQDLPMLPCERSVCHAGCYLHFTPHSEVFPRLRLSQGR